MHHFTPSPNSANTCAILVSYYADEQFFDRLTLIHKQFQFVVIVDNGSEQGFQVKLQQFCQFHSLKLIQNSVNFGIAKALNQGIQYAINQSYAWVCTFDQDTWIYPGLFSELTRIYDLLDQKQVIIGSNYFNSALNKSFIQTQDSQSIIERKTLITSGMLMCSKLPEQIGYFREDYFIDSVDHEFSLRARRYGYRLLMSSQILMRHSIGRAVAANRPALFRFPEHSPLRKYYITRNCLTTVFDYFRSEPVWCLKQLLRLKVEALSIVFFEQRKAKKLAAMGLGCIHALMGKMGALKAPAWMNEPDGR